MKAKPLRAHPAPHYPDKLSALRDPHLLSRNIPSRWRQSAIAASASLFITLVTAACEQDPEDATKIAPPSAQTPFARDRALAAMVAPLFRHGAGIASLACRAVTRHVYLCEEDALTIIAEELAKYGLANPIYDMTFEGVILDGAKYQEVKPHERDWDSGMSSPKPNLPLVADLGYPAKRVMIEYLSCSNAEGAHESIGSGKCDTPTATQEVLDQVKAQGHGVYFGAFYDPTGLYKEEYSQDLWNDLRLDEIEPLAPMIDKYREKAYFTDWEDTSCLFPDRKLGKKLEPVLQSSKDLLRAQVQDFVEWLKAQGVI